MTETLHIADLEFAVRRSSRRKTLGLTVDRGGELVVHAPAGAGQEELHQWVGGKLLWVHRKLAAKRDLRPLRRPLEFVSGESIYYLGQSHRLKLVEAGATPLAREGERFLLRRRDQSEAAAHFRKWFIRAGSDWLPARATAMVPKIGGGAVEVRVRDLGFRWGSHGRKGVLNFSWLLMQLPVDLVDYVVAHELAHRVERNHTPEFWAVLERAMPDCRAREAKLERHGHSYVGFAVERQDSR